MVVEVNKCHVKAQYDKYFHHYQYVKGDLVLSYDQASDPLGQENLTLCGMILTL